MRRIDSDGNGDASVVMGGIVVRWKSDRRERSPTIQSRHARLDDRIIIFSPRFNLHPWVSFLVPLPHREEGS